MRKLLIAAAIALVSATGVAAPPGVVIVRERDNGRTVKIPVGGELRAVLTARLGQHWGVYSDDRIELINPRRGGLDSSGPDKVSQGIYRLRVLRGGTIPVVFELKDLRTTKGSKPSLEVSITIDAG